MHSTLFRPPHGRIRYSQIRALKAAIPDVEIVMWDVLSGDFDKNLSPEKCLRNVLSATEAGSIVVFHDSLKAFDRMSYALPRALQYWREKRFKFGVL
ncbi:hypothetical protein [Arcticibacter sp. MXS-1]|uniref:hypothetical protein n=1 Tax=Arcticibacter sp. MXS-1 TaxID=3341726 RepID=UPI0035A891CF